MFFPLRGSCRDHHVFTGRSGERAIHALEKHQVKSNTYIYFEAFWYVIKKHKNKKMIPKKKTIEEKKKKWSKTKMEES